MVLIKYISLLLVIFISPVCRGQEPKTVNTDKTWPLRIAQSFLRMHPDSIVYPTEAKSRRWNYEQGLMLEAFYQMWLHTNDTQYIQYVKKNLDYYIRGDGSILTYLYDEYQLDNITPGKAALRMFDLTHDSKYRIAADTLRNQLANQPRTNDGGFWHKKIYPYQMWLDGLYMAEPFYTLYSVMFKDSSALDDVAKQFLLMARHSYDERSGLYFHGWDESKQQQWANPQTGCSPNLWGRVLGWYGMGLVDVLDYFPQSHPQKAELLKILNNLAIQMLKQRDAKTKLWYQVVDKPDEKGNYLEASVSSMFAYVYAKGANRKYLPAEFGARAEETFKGILDNLVSIDSLGIVHLKNVCSVSGLGGNPYRDGSVAYYLSEPKRIDDFKGYGPFLLAAIELEETPSLNENTLIGKGKTVALDYYFNCEWKKVDSTQVQFHYIWEDTTNSGFSQIGSVIQELGADVAAIRKVPTISDLKNYEIYWIVDPDTPAETEKPNYISEECINTVKQWVKSGGILILMGNDKGKSEFEHFNKLAECFGIHFNEDSFHKVVGKVYETGSNDNLPDHPIFRDVKQIFTKEISSLRIEKPAEPVLVENGFVLMASANFGRGFVFAVGDPWFYNEYMDTRRLLAEYENRKAGRNLFTWLFGKLRSQNK
jgi:unsaturated rhamnogalacturonyl hydrolase